MIKKYLFIVLVLGLLIGSGATYLLLSNTSVPQQQVEATNSKDDVQATSTETVPLAESATSTVEVTGLTCGKGKMLFPAKDTVLKAGEEIDISWKMPGANTYYYVDMSILDDRHNEYGSPITWNWIKYDPVDTAKWDAKTVYKKQPFTDAIPTTLAPGKYKLLIEYQYADSQLDPNNYGYTYDGCEEYGYIQSHYFEVVE